MQRKITETEMWKQLSTVGVLGLALAATPALAQQNPSGESSQPPAASQAQPQTDQGAASRMDRGSQTTGLIGQEVWSADGKKLGVVTGADQGSGGNIESLEVDVETYLGIGGETLEVGADQFTETEKGIELSIDAEQALPHAKNE